MNMTQKGAWFGVYLSALLVAVAIVDLIGILEYKGFPSPGVIVLHILLVFVFISEGVFLELLDEGGDRDWQHRHRSQPQLFFEQEWRSKLR